VNTLKVRINVSIASDAWSFVPGDKVELDVELANAWIEAGHASPIKGEKVDETELPEGVTYLGFGQFDAGQGQRVAGKKWAVETRELLDKHAAERAAEEAERAAAEEVVEDAVEGDIPADTGTDKPRRSKKTSEG
jgi:hypothetical protein